MVATPEEQVRQGLLRHLIDDLGFPAELLAVERGLNERRTDVVAYETQGENLVPLLLIECKAVRLSDAALHQVLGYNHHLGAKFVALVNQDVIRMPWGEGEIDYIPGYTDLAGV